jgi:hypothetical protein
MKVYANKVKQIAPETNPPTAKYTSFHKAAVYIPHFSAGEVSQ